MTCISHSVSDRNRCLTFGQFKTQFTLAITVGCLWLSPFLSRRASAKPAATIAQATSGVNLPPPPSAAPLVLPSQPLPTVEPGGLPPLPGEQIFRAPVTNPAPASLNRYRVFVNGDSPLLLQEVKRVEPQAFIQQLDGRRVIQVGIFSTEANARQQMTALAARGIATQMTTGGASSIRDIAGGYYVVVPGDRGTLPELRDRAIRLGVRQSSIQLRDRPLGPHVAIGPFGGREEAETLERYLRDKGSLDTRLYFDR